MRPGTFSSDCTAFGESIWDWFLVVETDWDVEWSGDGQRIEDREVVLMAEKREDSELTSEKKNARKGVTKETMERQRKFMKINTFPLSLKQ